METVVPLGAGLSAGLLVGFSAVLAGSEPEALGLSSSEKFFFNHLDGKHMVGIGLAEGEGEKRREQRGLQNLGRVICEGGLRFFSYSFYTHGTSSSAREGG